MLKAGLVHLSSGKITSGVLMIVTLASSEHYAYARCAYVMARCSRVHMPANDHMRYSARTHINCKTCQMRRIIAALLINSDLTCAINSSWTVRIYTFPLTPSLRQ